MNSKLLKILLKMKKNKVPISLNCTFSQLTTLGAGGTIYLTVFPENLRQLVFVGKLLHRSKVAHCFLGHGSNVLASDNAYNGVVVVTKRVKHLCVKGQTVVADCGVSTSKLCSVLVQQGLSGGEFFGCLPATVGGAVVCNAGCFGQYAADVVQKVTALCNGRVKTFTHSQCCFAHRKSLFKGGNWLVLQAEMRFAPSKPQQIAQVLAKMRLVKQQTQPLNARSAGCVLFSEGAPVSRLLDLAGMKGQRQGGAQVSQKHAGFVLNVDKAAALDIYLLIERMRRTLLQKYGVAAEVELNLINLPPPKGEKCPSRKV